MIFGVQLESKNTYKRITCEWRSMRVYGHDFPNYHPGSGSFNAALETMHRTRRSRYYEDICMKLKLNWQMRLNV